MTKHLSTALYNMIEETEALSIRIADLQRELALKRQSIEKMKAEIKEKAKGKKNQIKVSDHAFVRYFERVHGFDLKEIEKKILTKEVYELVDKLGDCTFSFKDFRIVIKNNAVITIT